MPGRRKKPQHRAPKPACAKPANLLYFNPLGDTEGLRMLAIWVTSSSPMFHRLAKVVLREICMYLTIEHSQVCAIGNDSLYVYDLGTQEGHLIPIVVEKKKKVPQNCATAWIDENRMFCCGGHSKCHIEWSPVLRCNDAFVLDMSGRIQFLRDMIEPRGCHAVIVFKDKAFVFGGCSRYGDKAASASRELFDFKTNSWSMQPNLHFGRSLCSVCRLRDRAYIYGTVPNIEIFWLYTETVTIAKFCLPNYRNFSSFVKNNQVVIFSPQHQITVRQEGENDVMQMIGKLDSSIIDYIKESYNFCYSVYSNGKFYNNGYDILRWINADEVSHGEQIFDLSEQHEDEDCWYFDCCCLDEF